MTGRAMIIFGMGLVISGCATPSLPLPSSSLQLDLSELDANGLRGEPDGKVAVSYEFCIPDTDQHRATVAAIDPTVQFMSNSPGRAGCSDTQCLCIGSTHQPRFRHVLLRLSALPYINEIRRCDFE